MSFRKLVLHYISTVPNGNVASYGQIAAMAGSPRAARQVGAILASLSTTEADIPWWRIVNSKGYISINNQDPFAKNKQKFLLEQEGIEVTEEFSLNIQKYRYINTPQD